MTTWSVQVMYRSCNHMTTWSVQVMYRSCNSMTNIQQLMLSLVNTLLKKVSVLSVFLDLSKAFNTTATFYYINWNIMK